MRKKIRSYLKGLAENRARAAGDIIRFERIAAEVNEKLTNARLDVESCDRLIKKYDARLKPERIGPIRVWPHHKGKRGELKNLLIEIIEREAPSEVSLVELCNEVEIRWELTFLTEIERTCWRRDAIGRALRRLSQAGRIAAVHSRRGGSPNEAVGRWRATSGSVLLTDHSTVLALAMDESAPSFDDDRG